jgi:ABC-2 type transport system ATP-binding protein
MEEPVIELHGIRKSYGKKEVLKGIDLSIGKGELFGLIGRNGAGKTTIFKIILGLSDYQDGGLRIGRQGESIEEGRKRIGFFIGLNFFPYLDARGNLEYYRTLKNIPDRGEVDRVLKVIGLDTERGKFSTFSLGMKQRLGIGNALLGNPEILILDEPVNGLDPQGIADVRHLVQTLNHDYGMTVIISSHILGELQHTAHRFGIVNNGVIAKVVTQEDLMAADRTVRLKVEDLPRARKALQDAGVTILEETQEAGSLEEYYFHLLEETDHA